MSERLHVYKKALFQSDSTPIRSQFQTRPFESGSYARQPGLPVVNQLQPRPFAVQARPDSNAPKTQQEIENEAFQQDKHSAFGLKLQAKYGTITLEGQERLTVLQAKMSDFLQRRLERASRFGHNFANIPISRPDAPSQQAVQTKLTIGEPGDKYEQEADRVAAKVVNQINAPVSQQAGQNMQREEISSEEKDLQMKPMLQLRAAVGGMTATAELETGIKQARSGGQPLADNIREPMEQAFGADFSKVKVHTDTQADQLNQSIQAKAFTTGQDVFFRQGEYNLGSRGGQELIAHELTHVVQQNCGGTRLVPTSVVQKKSKNKGKQREPVATRLIGGADLSWEPSLAGPFYRYCQQYEVDVVNLQKGQYAYKESNKGRGAVWFTTTSEVVGMLEERPFIATLSQIILPPGTSEETVWLNYESSGELKESEHPSRIIVKNNEPNNYGIGRNIYKESLSNITVKVNPKYRGSTNKKKTRKGK